MLLDDLKALSFKNLTDAEKTEIMNKYRVEMVYYLAIEAILQKYGTIETNEMSKMNSDALGCARDQMASRLSDAGVVNYEPETGHIKNLNLQDEVVAKNVIANALLNSEALRAVVTTRLASDNAHIEMSDDELFERVNREFTNVICNANNSDSILNNIHEKIKHTFEHSNNGNDRYAMFMHKEQILAEDKRKENAFGRATVTPAGSKEKTDETTVLLKISPLMPEIRELQFVDGKLYANIDANDILMYDAHKNLLTRYIPHADYSRYTKASELSTGLILGQSDYTNVHISGERTVTYFDENDNGDYSLENMRTATRTFDENIADKFAADIKKSKLTEFRWRMLHILEQYSQQTLLQSDIDIINEMFHEDTFGTTEAEIEENSNAYFDYIEHVCKTSKEKMSSHEFEIHLRHVSYLETDAKNKSNNTTAIMIYMTGERTSEYNKAKSNDTRFMAFYPYMDYVAKQASTASSVSPMMGDIESASYNKYLVTNKNIRNDVENLRTIENPYMHGGKITAAMTAEMRKTFDAYNSDPQYADIMMIRKVMRKVGDTNIEDLSRFINDGEVNADMIISVLVDDMNMTKTEQRFRFATNVHSMYFKNAVSRMIEDHIIAASNEDDIETGNNIAAHMIDNADNKKTMSDVIHSLFDQSENVTKKDIKIKLQDELIKNVITEIRNTYGESMDSFVTVKHLFSKYANKYIEDSVNEIWSDINDDEIVDITDFNADTIFENKLNEISAKIQDPEDSVLNAGLDELYGTSATLTSSGEVDKDARHIILKPNMCKYASKMFSRDVYEDLLKLLSHASSEDVRYEADMTKTTNDINDTDSKMIIQLFSADILNDAASINDDIENTEDEDDNYTPAIESNTWYINTFAKTAGGDPFEDDNADKSYAWLVQPIRDEETDQKRLVYRATHPLQAMAMRKTAEVLSSMGEFDSNNLRITNQGVIYYKDASDHVKFKIGPVIDEKAYIRPYVEVINQYDSRYEDASEITMPDYDSNGFVQYDAQGKAKTKTVRAIVHDGLVFENGRLRNPIIFGALDAEALTGDPNAISNRYYGASAQIANYDGYNHKNQSYINRMTFNTYKTSVLKAIEKDLALYKIANSETDETRKNIVLSLLYTNVCASSLVKCYHTNTYIIENKAKCEITDDFMSSYISDPEKAYDVLGADKNNENVRHALENIVSLTMMQSKMYHDRVVMPKITIDQNIGLYNQVLNLQQCSKEQILGLIDRKNMRNSDNKGARVAPFADNIMFDPVFSGTAKQLGAVAFFTDAVRFNDLTGEIRVANNATNASRCTMASTGVIDFVDGSIRCRLANYPGGQAVDRLQLSGNAIEKSLNYAENVNFAMINLGYNMEDGYIVAKRAAHKFGHFGEDGKYHVLEKWDKIGDTESGNKGVVSKIVDTDIGKDMSDEEADIAFKTAYMKHIVDIYAINAMPNEEFKAVLDNINAEIEEHKKERYDAINQGCMTLAGIYFPEETKRIQAEYGSVNIDYTNFIQHKAQYPDVNTDKNTASEIKTRLNEILKDANETYDHRMNKTYFDGVETMISQNIRPFVNNYQHEYTVWKLFRDNPDLDIAITNVCVNTRSNPSLLMYITDGFENEENRKTLKINDKEYEYAIGTYNIYVDSHTAEDKNRDYTKGSRKAGRKYGSQEIYAIQGKHVINGPYIQHVTLNDITLPDRIAKFNRKLIMNGFILNPDDNYNMYELSELFDVDDELTKLSEENDAVYVKDNLTGYSFIDIAKIAEPIMRNIRHDVPAADYERAIGSMFSDDADNIKEFNFGTLLSVMTGNSYKKNIHTAKDEDILRHAFVTSFAKYGGNFMILPESMNGTSMYVTHILPDKNDDSYDDMMFTSGSNYSYNADEYDDGPYYDYNEYSNNSSYDNRNKKMCQMTNNIIINGQKRTTVPLFVSAREIMDSQTEMTSTITDDKLQFKMFKCAFGCAMLDVLRAEKKISESLHTRACAELTSQLEKCYKDVTNPRNKSLGINDVQYYLKKNVYNTVFGTSATSVWAGDPTLDINQVGITFEMAKSLGLLKRKEGLSNKKFNKIPDDFEHMREKYEPLDENTYITINRSPGQTLGCVRLMKPFIMSEKGFGISVHPAVATIFDGDFDGDTIGVIKPDHIQTYGLDEKEIARRKELAKDAIAELNYTMSMQANLIQTADYTDVKYIDKNGKEKTIDFINPLFIAGNADIAVAKYNMMRDVDENGNFKCGYNIDKELECVMITANYIETVKQCYYDGASAVEGLDISEEHRSKINELRVKKLNELSDYLIAIKRPDAAKFLTDMSEFVNNADNMTTLERLEKISKFEHDNMQNMLRVYNDMTGYMSKNPCFTHGESQLDMICNIIKDTNITKKGKDPQLNALLMFSGVHEKCMNGCLKVIAQDKKYVVAIVDKTKPADKNITGILKYDENDKLTVYSAVTDKPYKDSDKRIAELASKIKFNYKQARSDVPESKHRTQTESNIVAQSDKSDATGLGGSMAQKMQKIFAIRGYSDLGLRISGPITQVYLDAKQNVTKCEKNLKIGKSVLSKVCNFEYVHELSDEYIAEKHATTGQIYNGQFTFKENAESKYKKYLTLEESVNQLNNFLKVMGQPELSPIDRAIVTACLEPYCEKDKQGKSILKNPLDKCDKNGDITYASMYGYKDKYTSLITDVYLADRTNRKNLWHGSRAYAGNIDTDRICRDIALDNQPTELKENIEKILNNNALFQEDVEKDQERNNNEVILQTTESEETKSYIPDENVKITQKSQFDTLKAYASKTVEQAAQIIEQCDAEDIADDTDFTDNIF